MRKRFRYYALVGVILLVFLFLALFCGSSNDHIINATPAIYDLEVLKDIKNNPDDYPQLSLFYKEADSVSRLNPLTVTSKEKTFAPSKNYYCSISCYAWPDLNNPGGPYVIKDGLTNPEYYNYDGILLESLANRIQHLSVAYYISGENKYKGAALKQLKVWFINKQTRMLPNFEYAQVQPGTNNNKGQTYGLAELSHYTTIIESIMLLDSAKGLSIREKQELIDWFKYFLCWLLNSRQWHIISKANNNNITSTSYLALVEMSLFTGNTKVANKLASEFKDRIIEAQIEDDGKQPAELRRTVGFGYSVDNLEEIIDFCLVMENLGNRFYKGNKKKIDAAFNYLYQFIGNHESFPYQQEASWTYYENKLIKNMKRTERFSEGIPKTQARMRSEKDSARLIMDLAY